MIFFVLLGILSTVFAAEIGIQSYDGYQVLSASPINFEQEEILKMLHDEDQYDFWSLSKVQSDIMASPEQLAELKKLLEENGIKYSVKMENVGKIVTEQKIENDKRRSLNREKGIKMSWDSFQAYPEFEDWVDGDIANHPYATVENIGMSSEGRDLKIIKLSNGIDEVGKKSIFIDGTFHAREWISGAFCCWIIKEILYNSNYLELLEHINIYVVPYVNPDGYEYSRITDRMWRKTRNFNEGNNCRGVDPNRNFGYMWGQSGTSNNPCSDIYLGKSAFSEPETIAIRDYILKLKDLRAYITIHSYGQYCLIPWGYAKKTYPPDYPELFAVAKNGTDALQRFNGTIYTSGQSADVLNYAAAGASDDWAKSEPQGIKYSYTLELRDKGGYMFTMPPSEIIPTCEETMKFIDYICNTIITEVINN